MQPGTGIGSKVRYQQQHNILVQKLSYLFCHRLFTLRGLSPLLPTYCIGQKVWHSTQDIPINNTPGKLAPRFIGLFPSERIIDTAAITLLLPSPMRIHPTFHVSQVKHVSESPLWIGTHSPVTAEICIYLDPPFCAEPPPMTCKKVSCSLDHKLIHYLPATILTRTPPFQI